MEKYNRVRLFTMVIWFFLIVHIWFPWLVYKLFGYFAIYMPEVTPSAPYVDRTMLMISIPLLLSIFIIKFSNRKRGIIDKASSERSSKTLVNTKSIPTSLYVFAAFLEFAHAELFILHPVFSNGIISQLYIYASLFFNSSVLLILIVADSNKQTRDKIVCCLVHIVLKMLTGSRSSAFFIVMLMFVMLPMMSHTKRRKIVIVFSVLTAVSIGAFYIGTSVRGSVDWWTGEYMIKTIVGRLSMLELGTKGVSCFETNSGNMALFFEKYSIGKQIKLIMNSLIPGNIFPADVQPNQYFRAAFMDYTEEFCSQYYTSINLCLPVYLTLKYGYLFGSVLTVFMLVGSCNLIVNSKNSRVASVCLFLLVYDLLYYFDWVYIFARVFTACLTLICLHFVMQIKIDKQVIVSNTGVIKVIRKGKYGRTEHETKNFSSYTGV